MKPITEMELDLLTELVNQGMGRAGASLSLMVQDEVKLSVPELLLTTFDDVTAYISKSHDDLLSGVQQDFEGGLSGSAFLIFSDKSSIELVRIMLDKSLLTAQLSEFEEEALNELGNVILNSAIGTISNALGNEIIIGLPVYVRGESGRIFNESGVTSSGAEAVILVKVQLLLEKYDVQGYVLLVLDIDSLSNLKAGLSQYLDNLDL